MTVKRIVTPDRYVGLAGDTKPTHVRSGATYYAYDTGILYITNDDGTTWTIKDIGINKAEDAAHGSGDYGIMALAVRSDTAAALAGTSGDYTPLIVDANGRLHVLDQNSAAMLTSLQLLDNAISSGNELQVDVVAALPAGTNAIGKLAANSGVDIGDVDVTSIAAGTNRVGTVSGVSKTVSVTKALASATAYDAEDVLSESASAGTVWTFAAIFRADNTGGYITKAQAICETTAVTPRLTLFLFNVAPTCALNDHAANTALLHADLAKYVGRIDFPAMSDLGTADSDTFATPSTYGNLPLWVDAASAADDLIGVLVTRDAFTNTATNDMTISLTVEQY